MFQKVITADDLDTINIAVMHALQELEIPVIQHSKYCDEAFLKIKKAQLDKEPYDLLITDLSFRADHRDEKIGSGEELIRAVRRLQPDIKILVFSIEDKAHRIKSLIRNENIDGYVLKGRNSIPELKKAIQSIYTSEQKFLSPEIAHAILDRTLLEIETYDIELLKALAKGLTVDDTSSYFQVEKIAPHGTSSIEKRINKLKIIFKANNNVHLIAIVKDLGLV
jgi:two-component system capsular synthesis response regulator RcsB